MLVNAATVVISAVSVTDALEPASRRAVDNYGVAKGRGLRRPLTNGDVTRLTVPPLSAIVVTVKLAPFRPSNIVFLAVF